MSAEGQEKIIDKLRKIMAHAESAAKIGNAEEATAFAEMFQKLLAKHKLEMTDVEWNKMEEDEPVLEQYVNYKRWDETFQARRTRVAWSERLSSIIAVAHYCQIVVLQGSNQLKLVGRKTDVAMAEFLIVTMQRLVEKISLREAHAHRLACRKSATHYAPRFRESFIQGFVTRLAERFDEAKRAQEGSSSTALVRVNKAALAVKNFIDAKMNNGGYKTAAIVRGGRGYSPEGRERGRKAADEINLKPNVVNSGSPTATRQMR